MTMIAVGLAPPAIVVAAKLVTAAWPSPVTAGPAAAAGIAVPPRSLSDRHRAAVDARCGDAGETTKTEATEIPPLR
jgi:hypothetical protein